jgi:hypothetical protein
MKTEEVYYPIKEYVMKQNLLKQVFNYMIPVAMGAAVFTACRKDKEDEKTPETHETSYYFDQDGCDDIVPTTKIKASADSVEVSNVYIVPRGTFESFGKNNISNMKKNALEPAVDVSPKVKGKGNLEFKPGVVLAEDSLWFVANGWTVNQK